MDVLLICTLSEVIYVALLAERFIVFRYENEGKKTEKWSMRHALACTFFLEKNFLK